MFRTIRGIRFALLIILLSFTSLSAQTVTYQANTGIISNPERGFFHYTSTGRTDYNLLNQTSLTSYRLNENVTVIQREFFLNLFVSGADISQDYLNKIQQDFNSIRNAGLKTIVRFAYSKDDVTGVLQQPSKARILAHITQLGPIINANQDIIVCIQAGFIGTYGEWYTTGGSTEFGNRDSITTEQWSNRNEVLTAIENTFSINIPLQVRYIEILQRLRTTNTRISIYNDAYLDNWGDSGTYPNTGEFGSNSAAQSFLMNLTVNLPMSGETDRFQINNVQLPRTVCTNALFESDRYNWSLLNTDYHPDVISNWQSNGCYAELQKKLGYRFELLNSNLTTNSITITLQNVGYANVFKSRTAYIVLRNTVTSQEYSFALNSNLRDWFTGQTITLTQSTNYNIPNGQYKMYLNLPDPNSSNTAYSIRCANLNVWESTSGYNYLNQIVTINNLGVKVFFINNNLTIQNLKNYKVKVYNMLGEFVTTKTDLSDQPDGIYIVKIYNKEEAYTRKVIKR